MTITTIINGRPFVGGYDHLKSVIEVGRPDEQGCLAQWPAEWWGNVRLSGHASVEGRFARLPASAGLPVPMRQIYTAPDDDDGFITMFTHEMIDRAIELIPETPPSIDGDNIDWYMARLPFVDPFGRDVERIPPREDAGVCLACQGWRYISEAGTTINCFDCDGEGWDDTPEGTLPSPQRRRGTGRIDGYRGPHEDYDPGDGSWLMDTVGSGTWRRWSVRPEPDLLYDSSHDAHLDDRALQASDELRRRHSTEHNAIGAPGNPDAVLPTGRMTSDGLNELRHRLETCGQGHPVDYWPGGGADELPRAYLLGPPPTRHIDYPYVRPAAVTSQT